MAARCRALSRRCAKKPKARVCARPARRFDRLFTRTPGRRRPAPSSPYFAPLSGPARRRYSRSHQGLVADAMRLVGFGAKTAVPISFVIVVIALKPHDLAISLEGEDVSGNPIQKPTIVGDNHCATCKFQQRLFQRPQG